MSDLAAYLASQLGGDVLTKPLSELITIVRFRGDFRNAIRFPDSNIATEIQAAWAELYELIDNTHEGYWDTDTVASPPAITTTVGQGYVTLPLDAWRIKGIDRIDGTDYVELTQVGIGDRNRYSALTDKPRAYRLTSRGADLYPTPDAVYTLRVSYTPVAPFLDETGRPFYNSWEEYIIYGALIRLSLNQDREASMWQQQLEMQRARIIGGATQRKAQEPEYLQLREVYIDADERWWP